MRGSSRFRTTASRGCFARCGGAIRGLVDLAEPIQLVPEDVEQEAVARRNQFDEVDGMGLVQFQDRDVGVQPAPPVRIAQERRGTTPRVKLLPVRLVKTFRPWPCEQFHDHFGGGGLAVRAADDGDAGGSWTSVPAHEIGIDFSTTSPGSAEPRRP